MKKKTGEKMKQKLRQVNLYKNKGNEYIPLVTN